MVGCFFMATKRYAEYREIGDRRAPRPTASRSRYYTLERLMVSIMFYASAAMLFLGAFIMRYRLELILAFPLVAAVMAIYLALAFKKHSAAQNPEGALQGASADGGRHRLHRADGCPDAGQHSRHADDFRPDRPDDPRSSA